LLDYTVNYFDGNQSIRFFLFGTLIGERLAPQQDKNSASAAPRQSQIHLPQIVIL
jgi:hypothetical protein